MNDYYFKVQVENRVYYSCCSASTYEQARRNLLFACFSYKHNENGLFKKEVQDVEDRYNILNNLYGNRVHNTTKELYEEKDVFQYD